MKKIKGLFLEYKMAFLMSVISIVLSALTFPFLSDLGNKSK